MHEILHHVWIVKIKNIIVDSVALVHVYIYALISYNTDRGAWVLLLCDVVKWCRKCVSLTFWCTTLLNSSLWFCKSCIWSFTQFSLSFCPTQSTLSFSLPLPLMNYVEEEVNIYLSRDGGWSATVLELLPSMLHFALVWALPLWYVWLSELTDFAVLLLWDVSM